MGKDSPLIVSFSPHITSSQTTPGIMLRVVVALLPAVLAGFYFFGLRAFVVVLVSVVSCAAFEFLGCLLLKKPYSLGDFSFLVTGFLYALVLPPQIPLGVVVLGAGVSILIGKQIYGGLGKNIFNPALVGRAFLMASFPRYMTSWVRPFDAVSSATPLGLWKFQHKIVLVRDLFWGNVGGCIGETSSFVLLLGGFYLLYKRIIDWRIVFSYLGTVFFWSLFFYLKDPSWAGPLFHLFSGGLMLGAFFMATDPVTSPITKKGRFMFGIGCGLMTAVIRYFGGLPEGVMYSILFMNALTPLIERFTAPKILGAK